ncbi:xanthine dehydrogenase family protein molybdopterin-binding subunit [Cloacibacillus porcorum]|uniref:Aldehyde oxidase/xanthine dehydrogenase a/b hammerhead domain-containing protein n=1 Tax=Cloacibacillus porcorum TaxID=1197717 RepID=A0A1B2I1Y8_9BACT|nr:molybdopterin cofactor-binding domain-containing protein [Cloacibacillus porcorum]ANZ43957.1 hypothetical protein BED41_01920 [Cloacibacillus porcorum]
MNKYDFVGESFSINDAAAKATGAMKFASDINLYRELHLKLILSEAGHALIKNIDVSEAEKVGGYRAILSYKDYRGKKFNSYRTFPDQPDCPEDRYIFADKARFVGDIIAVVACETKAAAERAARLVKVEYEELPVMASPVESLRDGAAPIHEGGNLIEEFERVREGKQFATGAEEAFRVTTDIRTQKMNHVAMETHSYLADWNAQDGVTIWTPTQGIYGIRTVVADMLDLPYSKVRVVKVPMGGSFGGKQEFIYEPLVAFVAKKLERPVKLHLTRRESMIATINRTDCATKITTAFDAGGRILSCEVDNLVDSGAYCSSGLDFAHAVSGKIPRLYRCPLYRHRGRVCYSNSPIAGGMRGWGSPEIMTALELHMDDAARKLRTAPVELRLKNVVEAGDVDICNGISLGNAQIKRCLREGAEAFRWKERFAAPHGQGRFRRGVGIACGAHKNGIFSGSPDLSGMTLSMNEDGTVNLRTSVHDVGCGTVRSMQIILAEVLRMDPDLIFVTEGDTKFTPYDCGTYGSRTTYVAGACAKETAEKFKELMLRTASKLLGIPASGLTLRDGRVAVTDATAGGISYRELAARAINELSTEMILTNSYKSDSNPGSYAVNFAEAEVDTLTGLVKITDFLSVNDIGQAINRQMVFNQIGGGVQMAAGFALCEDLGINSKGVSTKDSLKKYNTLNAVDMPAVKAILVEEGGDKGPFGAKSIGEISTVPGAAAIVNAVNNALGTSIRELPLTPERIVEAFRLIKG